MCEVLHFYSLSWDELLALPVAWFCKLYNRIPIIQARQIITWLPGMSYAHLIDDGSRRQVLAALKQAAAYDLMNRKEQDRWDADWNRLRRNYGIPASEYSKRGQNGH